MKNLDKFNKINISNYNSNKYKFLYLSLTLLYIIIGFILFSSFFISIDSVKSIVIVSNFWSKFFSLILSSYSNIVIIVSTIICVILSLVFLVLNIKTKFPPKITVISLLFNNIVCIFVEIVSSILYKYNIFFDFQILYILPLITIIFSSVFLIYDFIEYNHGKYNLDNPAKKLPTKELVEETLEIISNTNDQHDDYLLKDKINDDSKQLYEDKKYKTQQGYFNNDALEMAASHIVSSVDRINVHQNK